MGNQTELAYDFIRQRILDGTYRPAQRIIETQLAEAIGVSRNTLKKALLKLDQENLITIEENKGATIKSFTLDEVMSYMEIREVLEGFIAKKAAKLISEEKLVQLEEILEKMIEYGRNNQFDEHTKLNEEFHQIIYTSSGNSQAVEIVRTIKTQLTRYRFRTLLIPGRSDNSYKEHEHIFEALKNHDEKLAEEYTKQHVAYVRQAIKANFNILFM